MWEEVDAWGVFHEVGIVPYIRYVLTGSGVGRLKCGGNRHCSYWGIGFSLLIHHILLLLVEHGASMKSFQALRSPAILLTSFHNLLVLRISSSFVLRHVLFGLPLLLYPWGFQSNAVFSIAPVSLRNVCPIQFHFLLFIWLSIDFWWVIFP